MKTPLSIETWRRDAQAQLIEVGIEHEEALLEVKVLLEVIGEVSRTRQITDPSQALSADTLARLNRSLNRRVTREPLSHIIEEWEFWGLPFIVNAEVLTPRPDTEVLVEEALKLLPTLPRGASLGRGEVNDETPYTMIDVGAGTGCVGLSIASEVPHCAVTLLELSPQALSICQRNTDLLQSIGALKGSVRCALSDLLSAWPLKTSDPSPSLIVSNPPYIPRVDLSALMPEVRDYEPHLALIGGGVDGLNLISRLIDEAWACLPSGGALLLEVGYDQTQRVERALERVGFHSVWTRTDYAGNPRVVGGRRP